ncbi:MAG: hypothetical protein ACREFR_10215 [Limisphaerales bacterium]
MNFIKKNYEKIFLGAVLLGLFAALLYLPIAINADKQSLQAIVDSIIRKKPQPLQPLDMSAENDALNRVQSPYDLEGIFEKTNRLFNPMRWEKSPDGHWFPVKSGNEIGPGAVRVTKIVPLYYRLKLVNVEPANQFGAARYVISIEQQDAPNAVERRPRRHYLSAGEKDTALNLISVTGPAKDPRLNLQIIASAEQVTISKSKPFSEVTGYAADLIYPPENHHWYDMRDGAMINLGRTEYKVVVIDPAEVVISAPNEKKTTLPY